MTRHRIYIHISKPDGLIVLVLKIFQYRLGVVVLSILSFRVVVHRLIVEGLNLIAFIK